MALCRAPALRVAGRGAARPRAAQRAPRRAAASAVAEEPRQQQGGAGAGEAPEGGAPVVIQSYAVSEPAATKEAKSFTTLRPESVALASKVRAPARLWCSLTRIGAAAARHTTPLHPRAARSGTNGA